MGLENLKSVFAQGIGSRATSPGGRHGIDKHPPGHSLLDDIKGVTPITPSKPIPADVGNNAPVLGGRHGGIGELLGQHPRGHSQLDNFQPFMSTFEIEPNSSPLMDLITETNLESAFPANYTPINTLINDEFTTTPGNSLKDHGWPDLYKANHTSRPIDQPVPRANNPFQPFQYGNPNIAATLKIRTRKTDRGKEPYMVSNIGAKQSGTRLTPFKRAKDDFKRIGRYLKSPAGLLELAMANMHTQIDEVVVRHLDKLIYTRQRFNAGVNAFSILGAVGTRLLGQGVPNILFNSGFSRDYGHDFGSVLSPMEKLADNGDLPSLGGGRTGGLAQAVIVTNKQGEQKKSTEGQPNPRNNLNMPYDLYNLGPTFTGARMSLVKVGGMGIDLPHVMRAPGKVQMVTTGDKITLAPMISGKYKLSGGNVTMFTDEAYNVEAMMPNLDGQKDGMPFYFKDLRDDTYIFFRAYLEGITEDIAPSWAEHNYIGRSEPVYTYERATRTITFSLKLVAQTEYELQAIYLKMNRLTSLCYPQYAGDIRMGDKTRMKPPLMKFRLGDLFGRENDEMLGFIEALNYSVPESSTWEVRVGRRVPKHITANITYKVIHGTPPALTGMGLEDEYSQFYGYTGTFIDDELTDYQKEYIASVDAGDTEPGGKLGAKAEKERKAHNEALQKSKDAEGGGAPGVGSNPSPAPIEF